MNTGPRHIVVVGGGTAGWLAALLLARQPAKGAAPRRVTVVESSKIPTIGVGEGTTALFRQVLKALGLDEKTFLRETGATVKYGIRHRDWRRVGAAYDGPIDDVAQVAGPGLDAYAVASGRPVAEAHLFGRLMDRRRAPVAAVGGREVAAGPFHHAYHFDQARAGGWLRGQAAGAARIDDTVEGVERDAQTGDIIALALASGARLEGDLFVDCTGFRRALIGQMGARWTGYGDVLPVNRAMPFWLDLAPGEEIDPFTLAHARGAGWMWKIPTSERYGCGYVYSDAHTGPDAARAEIEAALGRPIEPRADIRIDAGRLDRPWIGNCVAIGLASSFLEPLEATSIHGTLVQLIWLSEWLGQAGAEARYNAAAARQVDDFRDFIRAHYISERRDTAFWRDVAQSHPPDVLERVAGWRGRIPERRDFAPFPMDLPHVQEQLWTPVLDGLGLFDRGAFKAALSRDPKRRASLRKLHDRITREYRHAAGRCLPHRAWLETLSEGIAA